MPFPLSSVLPAHPNLFALRPSPNARNRPSLFFPPGGHTHDRHSIPQDRLHISLSDPVLVAAEKRLSNLPGKKHHKRSIIENAGTIKTATKPGLLVLHLEGGNLFQALSACDGGLFAADAVNFPSNSTDSQETNGKVGETTRARDVVAIHELLDSLDGRCNNDISDVAMIASWIGTGDSLSNDSSSPDNSRYNPDLAPLASEMFKEELYTRGYLKKPTSRPSNITWKPRTCFKFASRKVFPKVLGRRQGRKVAECLRAEQNMGETAAVLDTHVFENQLAASIASATIRAPQAESPGTHTNTSASESFDLHEFSYITAFTTPPSSPSIVLDVKTLEKGACLNSCKHAA